MTKDEAKNLSNVFKELSANNTIHIFLKNKEINKKKPDYLTRYEYCINLKPKYRPYANAGEFLKGMKEHGMYIKHIKNGVAFYVWPTLIGNSDIVIENYNISYKDLCNLANNNNKYIWQDGHPCGILEY